MATYYRLTQSNAKDPIFHLFDAINFAQHEREKEIKSATKIQSIVKMKQQRTQFFKVVKAVIAVQRVFRGYQARKETLRNMISRDGRRQMQIFHYFATQIQSRFRGYISRKKVYDFYSQRRYIAGVVAKSEAVRKEASEALEKQLDDMSQKAEIDRRAAFEKTLANKHHLLSTATISGVYRPPLSVEGMGTVFGTSAEDELRDYAIAQKQQQQQGASSARKFKKDLPTRSNVQHRSASASPANNEGEECNDTAVNAAGSGEFKPSPPRNAKASSASAALGGGGMMGIATRGNAASSVFSKRGGGAVVAAGVSTYWGKGVLAQQPSQSLQSSTPYDMVEQQERHDKALNKAILEKIHGRGGFNVRRVDEPEFGTTVNCETPYADSKGLRKSAR